VAGELRPICITYLAAGRRRESSEDNVNIIPQGNWAPPNSSGPCSPLHRGARPIMTLEPRISVPHKLFKDSAGENWRADVEDGRRSSDEMMRGRPRLRNSSNMVHLNKMPGVHTGRHNTHRGRLQSSSPGPKLKNGGPFLHSL